MINSPNIIIFKQQQQQQQQQQKSIRNKMIFLTQKKIIKEIINK